MAESLTGPAESLSGPVVVERPVEERAEPAHRSRFRLAYAALVVVVWAAVAAFVVMLSQGGPAAAPAWSAWQPNARLTLDRAGEIAAHVAPLYRLADGSQLVGVQALPPEVQQSVPVEAIAISHGLTGQDIRVDSTKNAIFYQLFGLAANNAIVGTPSQARALLLRREALELALYTFRYGGGVDAVVAFLPHARLEVGGKSVALESAVYFRRGDFEQQLSRPLRETLPAKGRLTPGSLSPLEVGTVNRLTDTRTAQWSFTRAQDGGAVLVLNPLIRQ